MTKNIFKHETKVSKSDRQLKNNHKSAVIWFTGLSGSGKSTLAVQLERVLHERDVKTYLLDGDNVRLGLNSNLSFSDDDRKENMRRLGEVGKLFVDAGTFALVSAISPFEDERQKVQDKFEEGEYIEIYVKCPLDVCESRDPKGLYIKARNNEIPNFTGISSPYEEPSDPDIVVESDKESVDMMVEKVILFLETNNLI